MLDWLQAAWDGLSILLPGKDDITKEVLKYFIVAAITGIAAWAGTKLWKVLKGFIAERDARDRLARARGAVTSDKGIWLTKPLPQPAGYEATLRGSIPIICLANLKGGVGKTTVTANLAGAFAKRGEQVLVIDLDFQGSLTSMVLAGSGQVGRGKANQSSIASQILLRDPDGTWLIANAIQSPKHPKLAAVPAHYDLARTENRLLVEWLIRDQPNDMPYRLAKLLLSDEVQGRYQRILIDAPPRLSSACLQALCASTHLIIPTVMDQLSAEAVTTFANEIEGLKQAGVCPHISYLGVLGTMLPGGNTSFHESTVKSLQDELRALRLNLALLPIETWIKDIPALGRAAGQTVGILDGAAADQSTIRKEFDPLVELVAKLAPSRVVR